MPEFLKPNNDIVEVLDETQNTVLATLTILREQGLLGGVPDFSALVIGVQERINKEES